MGKQGEEGRVPGLPERLDVLVVDDDRVVLDELFACLEQAGLVCAATGDGWQALDLLARGARPAVVVTDIRMPELDGIEFAQRLARMTPRPEIVFVSGSAVLDDAVEALRLGARDLLAKPIDLRRLIQIVKEIALLRRTAPESGAPRPVETAATRAAPAREGIDARRMSGAVLRDLKELDRLRGEHLPAGMAIEASWEMLLDLYESELRGEEVSLTSLGASSGMPLTSAIRRIHELEKEGMIARLADESDRRRAILWLTDDGRRAVESFVESYLASRRALGPATPTRMNGREGSKK